MAQNPLKYTGLTYDDIMLQMNSLIATDPRFDNFRESAVAKFIVEMFAGTTDITNYYLQRRAEECYFDTAQHPSSIISLSRMFGYDITRPIPAKASLRVNIKGNMVGKLSAGDQIQIPYFSPFNANNMSFVLKETMTYEVSSDMEYAINTLKDDFTWSFDIDRHGNSIDIIQGEIREMVIEGNANAQLGATFQRYVVSDPEFSNWYGEKDEFYNKVTRIYVGQNKIEPTDDTLTTGTRFGIDRRSLINWENIAKSATLNNKQGTQICLIRTNPDMSVEVVFGNGGTNGYASLGAVNLHDNIYIQYLATKGSVGNAVGVVENLVNFAGKLYTTNGSDISSNITYSLTTNILGGGDVEDMDTIKYSAPKIYYSLDRLVSKGDYIAYLKTLTSPIKIKNAVAWGEQEQKGRHFADFRSFNAAFFSVLGSLYNFPLGESATYSVKKGDQIDSAVLDINYDEYKIQTQSFFNVYTRQLLAKQIKEYQVEPMLYTRGFHSVLPYATSASFMNALATVENAQGILSFDYASDQYKYASDLQLQHSVNVDLTTVKTIEDVQNAIKKSLLSVIDYRGDDKGVQNNNYGLSAFSDKSLSVVIRFDEVRSVGALDIVFNMVTTTGTQYAGIPNSEASPCYIYAFDTDTMLLTTLGLSTDTQPIYKRYRSTIQMPENGKIQAVVQNLANRSQITTQNIYMSPLIHSFELVGTVYVKSLFDKEEVRRQVNNNIYKWLDLNADFNAPIQKSNITQIIEENSGVVYVDYSIAPTGKPVEYHIDTDQLYANTSAGGVQNILYRVFNPYLSPNQQAQYATEDLFFNKLMTSADVLIQTSSTMTNSDVRFVYVSEMYVNGTRYLINTLGDVALFHTQTKMYPDYTDYMIEAISRIRASMSYFIKKNLINSYGNLGIPDTNTEGNGFVLGKYTIGSEIAKIDCSKLKYVYK